MLEQNYPIRVAQIGLVSVVDVSLGAIVQFGDRAEATPRLNALAVQRAIDHTKAGSVYFESYPIFNRPLPSLVDPVADSGEDVSIRRFNHCPRINVGCIYVTAVGSTSSLLAGNAMRTTAESRIKHIRQYEAHLVKLT
ncbi:spore germination protein GerPE [Paenibacillus glycanilyticus]|uniref:Spore germination protein GerPE n=1 Tax=Paenibacillus glycanilyticus TaxID=126569 RepID=A0ABQ6GGC3_9BACL|nr:spore germination protein GerPE [Paenibacillus glycanilyticus]GLX69130.1 putative spore germination protein GerPE [Paenibacillus glycanilyticus]